MADLSYPTIVAPAPGAIQGNPRAKYGGLHMASFPIGLRQDRRQQRFTIGVITDRVMLRTGASTEVPFALGRVWLLRLQDGWKAWEGWSDAGGYYTAEGLELGVEYIAVGIDPLRNHKATGAGPVRATLPEAS